MLVVVLLVYNYNNKRVSIYGGFSCGVFSCLIQRHETWNYLNILVLGSKKCEVIFLTRA